MQPGQSLGTVRQHKGTENQEWAEGDFPVTSLPISTAHAAKDVQQG